MISSNSLKELAPALAKAQAHIKGAIKDAQNPFFKNKYADLESCVEAVKGPLLDQGLFITQTMGFIPTAGPTLITTLMHISGEFISGEQPLCAKADDPQAMGSAISYARRYGLSAITGLVQLDDDAQGATIAKTNAKPIVKESSDCGSYVIPFGKFKGQTLDSIGAAEVRNYYEFLVKNKKPGEPESDALVKMGLFIASRTPKTTK
jgi:hypothetical protein